MPFISIIYGLEHVCIHAFLIEMKGCVCVCMCVYVYVCMCVCVCVCVCVCGAGSLLGAVPS